TKLFLTYLILILSNVYHLLSLNLFYLFIADKLIYLSNQILLQNNLLRLYSILTLLLMSSLLKWFVYCFALFLLKLLRFLYLLYNIPIAYHALQYTHS